MQSPLFKIILLFTSLQFLLSSFSLSFGQPDFRFSYCNDDNAIYNDTTSTYNSNINTVISYLSSQTGDARFYTFTAGAKSGVDQVNGIAFCQGDQAPSECKSCLSNAGLKIRTVCPKQRKAIGWYTTCMLRYSDDYIFSTMEYSPLKDRSSRNNASDPVTFNQRLGTLLQELQKTAAAGDSGRKYATGGSVAVTNFENIYALVECTPDLVAMDCTKCVDRIIRHIPYCCENNLYATYVTPSCVVRYNTYQFYNSDPVSANTTRNTGKSSIKGSKLAIVIGVPTIALLILSAVLLTCCFFFKRKTHKKGHTSSASINKADGNITSIESLRFDFDTIREATDNFSDANTLGQGGFGAVYKGILSNQQQIAVKRLGKNSTQGESEFQNEVLLVAQLQHRNLARLRGFCLEGEERLLIYDFLPNLSLDRFLFDTVRCRLLDWQKRYNIIIGTARGLLYLHEDSQLRIIHRDLKTSNILLDLEMNAKISDFGMARLFYLDQTHGDTQRVVGTYGYMAPEYAYQGLFSAKSDIYSFGILVLEMITGRRNVGIQQGENSEGLITWVWRKWRDGASLSVIHESILASSSDTDELYRCIQIGLLCVQENPTDRPTMSLIVVMLSTHSFSLPTPSSPACVAHNFND